VILFQSDGDIIASAVLLEYKRFEQHAGEGYEGCLYLDLESIKVFDPVTEHILIRIWPEIKKLGQVKWSLNPKGYVAFEQELRNVRTPASSGKEFVDIFPVSEGYDDWITGESIAQGFPPNVNAIPGKPINKCYHTLMVAIGLADNIEARILEAVIHIKLKCPGENKKVIFIAAKWDSGSWRKWADEFRYLEVILRIKGAHGETKL